MRGWRLAHPRRIGVDMDKKNPASVMDDLTRRGFTEQFKLESNGRRGVQSGQTFAPGQVRIVEQYRFEGVSDPDDMSIVYALETRTGVRGTITAASASPAAPRAAAFSPGGPRAPGGPLVAGPRSGSGPTRCGDRGAALPY